MGELGPWVVLTETTDGAHYLRVDRPAKNPPSKEPEHPNTERWWTRAYVESGRLFEEDAAVFYEADLPSEESGRRPYGKGDARAVAIWSPAYGVFLYDGSVSDLVRKYINPPGDAARRASG